MALAVTPKSTQQATGTAVPSSSPAAQAANAPITDATVLALQHKLRRVTAKRLPRVLQAIKTIGNLYTYKPSAKQRDFIIKQLRNELDAAEVALAEGKNEQISFDLPLD